MLTIPLSGLLLTESMQRAFYFGGGQRLRLHWQREGIQVKIGQVFGSSERA